MTPTDTTPQPQASEQLPAPMPPQLPATAQQAAPRITIDQLAALPESDHKKAWIDALMQAETARINYAQDKQYALDFFNSGQFDDLKKLSPQQAMSLAIVKMTAGREAGFGRYDSVRSIVAINGRLSFENELVAVKLNQNNIYWDFESHDEDAQYKNKPWKKCVGVTLWLKQWDRNQQKYVPMLDRKGQQISVSFGEGEAANAKIWENGKQIPLLDKWNYQSWARDMFYWRCVSRVRRYHAPHVLRGGVLREEAYDVVPVESTPPELLPADLQPALKPEVMVDQPAETTAAPPPPRKLRDRILGQESLLDPKPMREPGDDE